MQQGTSERGGALPGARFAARFGAKFEAKFGAGRAAALAAALIALPMVLPAGPAIGQQVSEEAAGQSAGVSVELNRLEQTDGACQAYVVVQNRTPADFESLALDLVMFDPDGIVSHRVAVEMAPLPTDKTSVRVFPVEGVDCGSIGRVLLNSVVSCRDGSGERDDCLGLIETSSRTTAPFIR